MNVSKDSSQQGFTLIELLIAVAIVAIISTIAFPVYNNYQNQAIRAQVMSDLGACAQALERHYTVNFTYATAAEDAAVIPGPVGSALCTQVSPPTGTPLYDITLQTANRNTFTLRATPVAGGRQAGDGAVEVFADGRRCWYDNDAATGKSSCD